MVGQQKWILISIFPETLFLQRLSKRDKRQCSIILRKIDCESVTIVSVMFRNICNVLDVGDIELRILCKLVDRRLFQAKNLNNKRKLL